MKISYFKAFLTVILFSALLMSCGDDAITATSSSFTFDELNTCDIGSGSMATRFNFTVGYDASSDIKVSKVLFVINWSSGDTDSGETTNFTDSGGEILYSWCYRYGSEEWVEIVHTLETEDGMVSNSSSVQINKPDGAN